QHIGLVLARRLPWMAATVLAALALGALGTWLVTRRVRLQTRGLAPGELRGVYDYHDAVLHPVREGVLGVDVAGRLHLGHDEATRLLGVSTDDVGRRVGELGLPEDLTEALLSGQARQDELFLTSSRVLVLRQSRTAWEGRDLGTVATLRDRTELESLTGELD